MTDFKGIGFEWDKAKRQANIAKHGLDFLRVTRIFEGPVVTRCSPRSSEDRFVSIGLLDGRIVAAVWTLRGDAVRPISARSARHGEQRQYQELYPAADRGNDRPG